nr:MAG TPA: hypothetical protein [Caudoviricetes sp.]
MTILRSGILGYKNKSRDSGKIDLGAMKDEEEI